MLSHTFYATVAILKQRVLLSTLKMLTYISVTFTREETIPWNYVKIRSTAIYGQKVDAYWF